MKATCWRWLFRKRAYALVLGAVVACTDMKSHDGIEGSGQTAVDVRSVENFTGITMAGVGDVHISIGSRASIKVQADDNLLPLLETEVRGGILTISVQPNVDIRPKVPIQYKLTAGTIQFIELSGAGTIQGDRLKPKMLKIILGGTGDINLNGIIVPHLIAELSGTGNIYLEGRAPSQNLELSGTGSYVACKLEGTTVGVNLSGYGDTKTWSTDSLNASISGFGSVFYKGSPSVESHVTGWGSVIPLDSCP